MESDRTARGLRTHRCPRCFPFPGRQRQQGFVNAAATAVVAGEKSEVSVATHERLSHVKALHERIECDGPRKEGRLFAKQGHPIPFSCSRRPRTRLIKGESRRSARA